VCPASDDVLLQLYDQFGPSACLCYHLAVQGAEQIAKQADELKSTVRKMHNSTNCYAELEGHLFRSATKTDFGAIFLVKPSVDRSAPLVASILSPHVADLIVQEYLRPGGKAHEIRGLYHDLESNPDTVEEAHWIFRAAGHRLLAVSAERTLYPISSSESIPITLSFPASIAIPYPSHHLPRSSTPPSYFQRSHPSAEASFDSFILQHESVILFKFMGASRHHALDVDEIQKLE
jgi:hypothetical protein